MFVVEHRRCHVGDLVVGVIHFNIVGHDICDNTGVSFSVCIDLIDDGPETVEFRQYAQQVVVIIDHANAGQFVFENLM